MDDQPQKKSIVKRAVKGMTDTVGSALALPWTIAANIKMARDASDANILRQANRVPKNVPQFDVNGKPTSGFMAQSLADGVKQRLMKNKVKAATQAPANDMTNPIVLDQRGMPNGMKTIQIAKPKPNTYLQEEINGSN